LKQKDRERDREKERGKNVSYLFTDVVERKIKIKLKSFAPCKVIKQG
jgi:hypothetical protein